MRPSFVLLAVDGSELAGHLIFRTGSLRVVDAAGQESDTLECTLDDRDGVIEIPELGKELVLWLGYDGQELVHYGQYAIDEVSIQGPPFNMTIGGKAIDMVAKGMKAPKVRDWHGKTVGEMVSTIAEEQGLKPDVDPQLAAKTIPHLQQGESDMHLMTRLAGHMDAIWKPEFGNLRFSRRDCTRYAAGEAVDGWLIEGKYISSFEARTTSRTKYHSAGAYYYDRAKAERVLVVAEDDAWGKPEKPQHKIRHDYPSKEAATDAAQSKLAVLKRCVGTLSWRMPGDARLRADTLVRIQDLRVGLNGDWYVTRVEHEMSGQGFTTSVEAELPK